MHLHLDLIGGIAGDMFLAAALDTGIICSDELVSGLRTLGLGTAITIERQQTRRGALAGTHVHFANWDPDADADHRYLTTILQMIDDSLLPDDVKRRAKSLFSTLGESEATVHGMPLEKVHFHEVGAVDSILDFVSAAWIIERAKLNDRHVSSWSVGIIPTGHGSIDTAHGTIPVPVPASAHLLIGFELETLPIQTECVTPTGAAILAELKRSHLLTQVTHNSSSRHEGKLIKVGHGLGTKDFGAHSNALRLMAYSQEEKKMISTKDSDITYEEIVKLTCDIDDMQPELLAYIANHQLPQHGAIDVVRLPVLMKEGRQGTQLQILAHKEKVDTLVAFCLRETSTLGIRVETIRRALLPRRTTTLTTPLGLVEVKIAGNKSEEKIAPEFRSVAALAQTHNLPIAHVWDIVKEAISAYQKGEK